MAEWKNFYDLVSKSRSTFPEVAAASQIERCETIDNRHEPYEGLVKRCKTVGSMMLVAQPIHGVVHGVVCTLFNGILRWK